MLRQSVGVLILKAEILVSESHEEDIYFAGAWPAAINCIVAPLIQPISRHRSWWHFLPMAEYALKQPTEASRAVSVLLKDVVKAQLFSTNGTENKIYYWTLVFWNITALSNCVVKEIWNDVLRGKYT
ncbi:hypothetical protein TNCV_4850571 [Trichonephila clavipes]|nr:hypothetical protein TNCV_4850571 [Trichonephila clavipes]